MDVRVELVSVEHDLNELVPDEGGDGLHRELARAHFDLDDKTWGHVYLFFWLLCGPRHAETLGDNSLFCGWCQ